MSVAGHSAKNDLSLFSLYLIIWLHHILQV